MAEGPVWSRRTLLRATTGAVIAARVAPATGASAQPRPTGPDAWRERPALRELDERIRAGMERHVIPGVAVGVRYRGHEYVRGYGVTNVAEPVPVDGDTAFRIGSTTKTFTATVLARLGEHGRLRLDAPVRTYLPDFTTADSAAASRVTVRHLLNHSAGWVGDYVQDFGSGDDALAAFVAGMARLPQLTPPGEVFAYNNAAVGVAGRLVEVVTGRPYEQAARQLLIDRLGLTRSRFFPEEFGDANVAAPHTVVAGDAAFEPTFVAVPRTLNSFGGLLSSARDQLRYARFHLGDGTAPDGRRLLSRRSLAAMRSHPGPGGTLGVEIDGAGLSWILRPTSEGVRVVEHGGSLPGQRSGFLMVPGQGFVLTVLTNSVGGGALIGELFYDDWALRRFAGLTNLRAEPRDLTAAELAPFEGPYTAQAIGVDGVLIRGTVELVADAGGLRAVQDGVVVARLKVYGTDHVLVFDPAGAPQHSRGDFRRDPDGRVAWLRIGGRLYRHEEASPAPRTAAGSMEIAPPTAVATPRLVAAT